MSHREDPAARLEFIASLRELADYLDTNPAVPVPSYGQQLDVIMNRAEEGGCHQVDQAARLLGVTVTDETSREGHYYADKQFGCLLYRVVSISQTAMARHYALWSYKGCVTPGKAANDC